MSNRTTCLYSEAKGLVLCHYISTKERTKARKQGARTMHAVVENAEPLQEDPTTKFLKTAGRSHHNRDGTPNRGRHTTKPKTKQTPSRFPSLRTRRTHERRKGTPRHPGGLTLRHTRGTTPGNRTKSLPWRIRHTNQTGSELTCA